MIIVQFRKGTCGWVLCDTSLSIVSFSSSLTFPLFLSFHYLFHLFYFLFYKFSIFYRSSFPFSLSYCTYTSFFLFNIYFFPSYFLSYNINFFDPSILLLASRISVNLPLFPFFHLVPCRQFLLSKYKFVLSVCMFPISAGTARQNELKWVETSTGTRKNFRKSTKKYVEEKGITFQISEGTKCRKCPVNCTIPFLYFFFSLSEDFLAFFLIISRALYINESRVISGGESLNLWFGPKLTRELIVSNFGQIGEIIIFNRIHMF